MNQSHHPDVSLISSAQSDRLGGLMSHWYGLLQRHRFILTAALIVLGGWLFTASNSIVWQTSLLSFFSSRSASIHDLRLSENRNGLADAMRLDVHFSHGHRGDLRTAVDVLVRELQEQHEFSTIWHGVSVSRQLRAQAALDNNAPILLAHPQLDILRRRLSAQWLTRHFHRQVEKMAGPDGQITAAQLQDDPLGMRQLLLLQLKSIGPGSGAHLSGPLLVSRNGRHAMIILAPPFKPQNVGRAERMLAGIRTAIHAAQGRLPFLRVWVVGPYRNFVENQRLVKRDLKIISAVGTLLVAAAIGLYFRRISSVVVCLIPPMVGLGAALGIAGLLRMHIPLIVLGFDGLLCGATTDYGIQLMSAMNRMAGEAGRFDSTFPARAARELFGPISMSVCTSMTGYGALAASAAPGLRALGLFIAGATGCIWLVTFLVLPAYLGPWVCRRSNADASQDNKQHIRPTPSAAGGPSQWWSPKAIKVIVTIAFILVTLWLGDRALAVRYISNGESLDGSSPALKHDQAMFAKTWGHLRQSGVITIHAPSAEAALRQLQQLEHTLARLKGSHLIAAYSTPAGLLPDAHAARRRLQAWRALWTPERLARAKRLIAKAANATALRPGAFNAAIHSWQFPVPLESALRRLEDSPAMLFPGVVRISRRDIAISSTVQLNASLPPRRATQWAAVVRHDVPGVSIICGDVLYLNASRHAQMEARHLFPWVALLIIIPLWIYFRRLDIGAIAALSLGIGFIWLLGVAQLWGGGLNLLSLVPMLFTMGVAVDYGIYAASDPALRRVDQHHADRNGATFVCAATTILGTAAMIPAGHPVLHWIGLTLTAGILGGYLASYFIVGPLVRVMFNPPVAPRSRRIFGILVNTWRAVVALAIVLLLIGVLGGCCTVPPLTYQLPSAPPPTAAAARQSLAAFPRRWNQQFFADVNWHGHQFSMIGQITGQATGTLRVTCASEFGTLLSDVRVSGHRAVVMHIAAGFPAQLAGHIAENAALALRMPTAVAGQRGFTAGKRTLTLTDHHIHDVFFGTAGHLRVCRISGGRRNMEILYQHYGRGTVPQQLQIRDAGDCLLLTINFDAK
jgi:predicted exporter